ncbi:MAG: hypothetical protein ACK5SX_12580 [Sandaracinobacter sp.]
MPASAAQFRVDWGGPDGSDGFLGVTFQPFAADRGGEPQLARAVDGRRDLLDWLQTPAVDRPVRPVRSIAGGGGRCGPFPWHGCAP